MVFVTFRNILMATLLTCNNPNMNIKQILFDKKKIFCYYSTKMKDQKFIYVYEQFLYESKKNFFNSSIELCTINGTM